MTAIKNVLAICGSLRQASLNAQLLQATEKVLDNRAQVSWANIADLPHYNGDLDGDDKPLPVTQLVAQINGADALIIATPEYNYGVPGTLKNALDWASRPAFKSCLAHKPVLLMSASPSPVGGVRAQGQLKQILGGTLSHLCPVPEFALGGAATKFENGVLVDSETQKKLERLIGDFLAWLE
ncbi:NADPH-dependent FMN reductase [Gilvimarinus sp. SDUM040013]|uniref:NADPH-dependent FMN reductase n=1 Tax=Gilvimarinus gilvus TaxID=3058038 RepID=A0ABU4RT28_9GAMM|nr:NADPH-dependent FMN reductase [Gilvimarinus sp. SDUM040013]MDO3387067.1 NADPH-dependent FMN reductase [Gilvimarinus sp. SDUM040013]MDX6848039.1 NADPH-dependent FMN reductase [Gilvimarinus sp. SDUM040013]